MKKFGQSFAALRWNKIAQTVVFSLTLALILFTAGVPSAVPAKAADEPPGPNKGVACNKSSRYVYVFGQFKDNNWEWITRGLSPGVCTQTSTTDADAVFYKTCTSSGCTLKAKKVGGSTTLTLRDGGWISEPPGFYLTAGWFVSEFSVDYVPPHLRPNTSWINYTIK